MNRLKIVRSGAGILCAALLATAAYAQPDDRPNRPDKMGRKDRMESRFKQMDKELGLTADQENKLEEHRKSHREESRQLFEQMRQKREALEVEMEKPDLNMDKINAIHSDLKNVQSKMADQRLEGILEVRKILTPEQFKKFHEITRKNWKRGGKEQIRGKGKGPGYGHGPNGEMGPGPDEDGPPPMK